MNHAFSADAGWAGGAILGGAVVFLLLLLAIRLLRYRGAAGISAGDFSLSRFEPMAWLLSDDDITFLAAQPGYRPEVGATLRRDRRRIFRMYLRELAQDFQKLHAEARKMAALSPEQNSELIGSLLWQQATFWRALAGIEVRLLLPNVAVPMRDLRGLIASVEATRLDLVRMSAA